MLEKHVTRFFLIEHAHFVFFENQICSSHSRTSIGRNNKCTFRTCITGNSGRHLNYLQISNTFRHGAVRIRHNNLLTTPIQIGNMAQAGTIIQLNILTRFWFTIARKTAHTQMFQYLVILSDGSTAYT